MVRNKRRCRAIFTRPFHFRWDLWYTNARKDGRVDYCGCLENSWVNSPGGSNPSPSVRMSSCLGQVALRYANTRGGKAALPFYFARVSQLPHGKHWQNIQTANWMEHEVL